ncbi:MAG TPA: response regulator transcription factor [Solirubrobacterales bacterium]|jgi:DNA-binding response OmpR family regulator|nr:response regulator transcription factor [Solirubrobacterales bacterium]
MSLTDLKPLRVLIVEDDAQQAAATQRLLEKESFEVAVCHDAESGLDRARAHPPDLIVLDVNLPGIDGIEACRRLRTFSDAYVVMLTGLDNETDRVVGLSVGADDYVAKPYSPRELVARIRAMQRRPRAAGEATPPREFGALRIDPGAREVTVGGQVVELSRTEFDVLDALAAQPRVTLSRQQLLEAVWGQGWFGDDHVIDVHISNLRRKLGDSAYVKTVRGFGYRMGEG